MLTTSGIFAVVFGSMIVVGQIISAINFRLAQKLGLQEKGDDTDPLFRRLELSTARWDLFVLWTLPAAGVLMLVDHGWWPYLALLAGGVYVDTAGRETAKFFALRSQRVKTGSTREGRTFLTAMGLMSLIGLWCIGLAFARLT